MSKHGMSHQALKLLKYREKSKDISVVKYAIFKTEIEIFIFYRKVRKGFLQKAQFTFATNSQINTN